MELEITKELIERVAQNARLQLTEQEKTKFQKELAEIIRAFSSLNDVDTKDVQVQIQPVPLKNHLREDVEGECLTQDEALSLTEHKKDGYFKGPKIV